MKSIDSTCTKSNLGRQTQGRLRQRDQQVQGQCAVSRHYFKKVCRQSPTAVFVQQLRNPRFNSKFSIPQIHTKSNYHMSGQVNNGAMSQSQESHKHCHTLGPSTCPPFTVFLGPGLVLLSVRFAASAPHMGSNLHLLSFHSRNLQNHPICCGMILFLYCEDVSLFKLPT